MFCETTMVRTADRHQPPPGAEHVGTTPALRRRDLLAKGQLLESWIEGVGTIRNRCV